MSHELQQLVAETRELIATSRRLKAEYEAQAKEYLIQNTALCVSTRLAIVRSTRLLVKDIV